MSRTDGAAGLHARGANCAQSVACAFCADLGMDETATMRAPSSAKDFPTWAPRLHPTMPTVNRSFAPAAPLAASPAAARDLGRWGSQTRSVSHNPRGLTPKLFSMNVMAFSTRS